MELKHKKINFDIDREYVLERHCRTNYECDCPWKRKMPYNEYRDEWFALQSQINGFSEALLESMKDNRTIAEIIENDENEIVAYLWVPFYVDDESGFCFADAHCGRQRHFVKLYLGCMPCV